MLEKIKKVRKLLIILMAIIVILGVYIKVRYNSVEVRKIQTISAENLKQFRSSEITPKVDLEQGTINPIYRPEWTIDKDENGRQKVYINKTAGTLTITVKGSAYETQNIDSNSKIDYASDVTSILAKEDITVFVDGVEATDTTNPQVTVNTGTTISGDETESGKTEVTHTIVLSNLEGFYRPTSPALPYKEWSGNITLKIAGRGKDSSTYNENVLTDIYGNQNMMETDQNGTNADGTWINILFSSDEEKDQITASDPSITPGNITTTTPVYMFTDFIKPEFTYKSAETTIGNGNNGDTKKVTVLFDVVDKYFNSSTMNKDDITVSISDYTDEEVNSAIDKQLNKTADVVIDTTRNTTSYKTGEYTLGATEKKIGERYELVISELQQSPNDAFKFSGYMSLTFPAGHVDASGIVTVGAKDNSGNLNPGTTITIGIDEKDGKPGQDVAGDGTIVDTVDPIWKLDGTPTVTTTGGITTATMNLIATDKYFSKVIPTTEVLETQIQVKVANIDISSEVEELTKNLEYVEYVKLDGGGNYVTATEAEAIGAKYTFTISNLEESYEAFIQARANNERVYREYTGPTQILIPADTIEDESGNKNEDFTIDLGHIDTLKPEVVKVSSRLIKDASNIENSKYEVVFDITDKYLASSDINGTALNEDGTINNLNNADTSKIHVLVDGESATSITKKITGIQKLTATVGANSEQLVGYRYTLELSNFENERTTINFDREYTDWSGNVTIKIDANTAKDTKGTGNAETELKGIEGTTTPLDFVDFIKPDVTYQYTESSQGNPGDINYEGKTFTMVFDITDKHFANSTLEIEDLTILIDGELDGDTNGNGVIDGTEMPVVTKTLTSATRTNTVNGTGKTIGTRYTLVLSNLEQLQIKDGDKYLDYSGVITVAIPAGQVDGEGTLTKGAIDSEGNLNDATTITSGIDIPGGAVGDAEIVDVVDPVWELVSTTTNIHTKTSTIIVKGTDKYLDITNSTLTSDNIKLFIDGTETTGTINVVAKTVTKDTDPDCFIEKNIEGTSTFVQIGKKYTITVTDFPIDKNQVKIRIAGNEDLNGNGTLDTGEDLNGNGTLDNGGSLVDTSGNDNKWVEFMVYNTLRTTEGDKIRAGSSNNVRMNSGFLGSSQAHEQGKINDKIERQNIENVTFLSSTETAPETGTWDVSAQGDNSIIAWYETSNANGALKVYIASDEAIYGNVESNHLFTYIGYSEKCTATEAITNINLLNTSNVTCMIEMFWACGYTAMTNLDLGSNFDTSNVTDMDWMFGDCGFKAMINLDLGDKFDTTNVRDMNNMFCYTGGKSLQTLNFGSLFDTSNVTDMHCMFQGVGYNSNEMENINLGDKFDTSNVTNMQGMFDNCGYTAMKSLDLGDKFDTSNVTNMEGMFYQCGYTAMTSLDLGDKFDTSNVTNMEEMFGECGYTAMTSLNLGEKFDTSNVNNMAYMFYGCGYTAMTSLDLGDKFDTSNVINMRMMFENCGYKAMIELDLGDKFYTTKVTDMLKMFKNCGYTAMLTLDLGPAFTRIAETNTDFIINTGKEGCIIYAPESIYNDKTHLKLYTNSTTTIEYTETDLDGNATGTRGTINPKYRTEWVKETTNVTVDETNIANSKIEITLRGQLISTTPKEEYITDVTSTIPTGTLDETNRDLIKVFIDETDITDIVEVTVGTATEDTVIKIPAVEASEGVEAKPAITAKEVLQKITITDFEEATRRTGIPFKEWSGNIALKIAKRTLIDKYGSYTVTTTETDEEGNTVEKIEPVVNIFTDASGNYIGNGNMESLDNESGQWIDIQVKDETQSTANANGKMFADFIKPEFTYKASETTIGNGNNGNTKKVTVLFDVVDKYFNSSTLSKDNITVSISDYTDAEVNSAIDKQLNKTADVVIDTTTGTTSYKTGEYTLGATEKKIGERYELVISELQQSPNDGFKFSGPMSLTFPAGQVDANGVVTVGAKDNSGNLNPGTTITIGIDDVDGNPQTNFDEENGTIVDVVDPIWQKVSASLGTGQIVLRATDKYYASNSLSVGEDKNNNGVLDSGEDINGNGQLDENNINVYVNGVLDGDKDADGKLDTTNEDLNSNGVLDYGEDIDGDGNLDVVETINITKALGNPVYKKLDESGNYVTTENVDEAVAVEYTLQLSNITLDEVGYTEFTPVNADELVGETAKYRSENGGKIDLKIEAGTIEDHSGNKNILTEFEIGKIDSTSPEIYDIQKIQDPDGNTQTFIFNVTDRNYLPTDLIETTEITTWVDGIQIEGLIAGETALTSKEIKAAIDGTTKVLGHQYTLVLSNIVETIAQYRASGREFQELSGTVEIRIAENAAKDDNGNTIIPSTTKINDFVDYIKPEVTYVYSESAQANPGDIDYEGKTFTMVFEIIDKYFANSTFETELAEATTDAEKQEVIEKYLTILIDGEEPDWTKVNKDITISNVTAETSFNRTVDGAIVTGKHVIGRRYELVLSNLEELQIKDGDQYLDYSGIVTVALKGPTEEDPTGVATDTEGNINDAITITSGVNLPGGEIEDAEIVDVVDPMWELVSTTTNIHTKTSTIIVKGTDKYLDITNSTLTSDNIKLFIDGTETTGTINVAAKTVTKDTDPDCFVERTVNGTTTDVQIGVKYTITVTNFPIDKNQVKIRIAGNEDLNGNGILDTGEDLNGNGTLDNGGSLVDTSGNDNKWVEFMVYNTLRTTNTETSNTKGFLGNASIQRQNIENVTFLSSTETAPESGTWDVSAQQDETIIAWYETSNANGALKVYIASDEAIYGNIDSSHLFEFIGSGANCIAAEVITNIGLLNTSNVTSMKCMFSHCGYTAMTELDLGNNFDTSNVTDMFEMFNGCGDNAMISLELGDKFDTSNVTNMGYMFQSTGFTAMPSLTLPANFDTSNVTSMKLMFESCGYTAMTSLDLGDKFDTSNVTDMEEMFGYCGYTAMTSLDLGEKFDTSNVNNMAYMFYGCGYTAMTSLDLGEKFDTSNVTNMEAMFFDCGYTAMTSLDLGDEFDTSNVTSMKWMFIQCGYTAMTTLDLGDKFNTSNVTDMQEMFVRCGYTAMTSLDLGDKFYTTNSTDVIRMFAQCGYTTMTKLDLGPAFTRIPNGEVEVLGINEEGNYGTIYVKAYKDFITNTGASGCIIYAPESIYNNRTHLKLDTNSTTTIEYTETDADGNATGTRGTINPKYRTEWVKETTNVTVDETNIANSKIEITLRGQLISTTPKEEYITDVTSTLPIGTLTETNKDLIKVFIDETEITDIVEITVGTATEDTVTKIPATEAAEGVEATEAVTAKEVLQTITITDFGEATRRTGIPFKEWSGNITLKIAKRTLIDKYGSYTVTTTETDAEGNTVETTEPVVNVFTDADGNYIGNGNMESLDNESGEWIDIQINEETESTANTDGKMFADFIKPEFTYKASETTIGNGNNGDTKQVAVVFEVTDKYFKETTMTSDDITIKLIDTDPATIIDPTHITKTLTKTHDIIMASNGTVSYKEYTQGTEYELQEGETRIGEKYHLLVEGLEQTDANGLSNGYTYSGPMSIVFDAGKVADNSTNLNDATTITIGVDETDGNTSTTESGSASIVDVVDPTIYYSSSSIDRFSDTVTVMLRADDKYLTSEKLVELQNNVIVKVVKPNGEIVTDRILTKDANGTITASADNEDSTITKTITRTTKQDQYMMFQIILSNFGADEGVTSLIIPEDVIFDTSGNGNKETEILIGNPNNGTAFKDSIVDFTDPIWKYSTSSIQRNRANQTGTVTLEVKGTDIYFDDKYFNDETYQLNLSNVSVKINGEVNSSVTKTFATNDDGTIKKEYVTETAENGDILKGVKYTIILGNFGTNEGTVNIVIPQDAIRDTSTNKNQETPINVGNPAWVETDVDTDEDTEGVQSDNAYNPKYNAFRNNIVDYIKPIITYQYEQDVNPLLDTENEQVQISFNVTDTNFLESNIGLEDLKIYIDNMQVYGTGVNDTIDIGAAISNTAITDGSGNGLKYTITLSTLELNRLLAKNELAEGSPSEKEVFERHSGVIKIVVAANQVEDSSGNKNNETTIIIDNDDGNDEANGVIVDFVNPIIYYHSKYINWDERYALITLRATDRFFDTNTKLETSEITIYKENSDGDYIQTNEFDGKISISEPKEVRQYGNLVGYDYTIKLSDFEEEFNMKFSISQGAVGDTSQNYNDAYNDIDDNDSYTDDDAILVTLDNKKPRWEYISTNTALFESDGKISFNVKGVDKFLNITNSGLDLDNPELKVLKDGEDITSLVDITVTYDADNSSSTERSKAYSIDIEGLTDDNLGKSAVGTYSLVFEAFKADGETPVLIDEFENGGAAKTITFSKSAISSNTGNYTMITYHVTPDYEMIHSSYVHELMAVNETGTNYESATYFPSSIGELHNDGENPLFAEPMYKPVVNGYDVTYEYEPMSFAGWAVADEKGNAIDGANVYGLYDEIPNTITNLKAIWQKATVVFVSNTDGDNSNDGKLPTTPVKTLEVALEKFVQNQARAGNVRAEQQIVVIMDEIEWNSNTVINSNLTITSLYAGIDYRQQGAELKISSNMEVNGSIIFDNIELYANSTTVSNGSDYLGNGTYTNMLISNYSGDITLGRGITTPEGKYTFGAIIGGNYKTETATGENGAHTIRVEAGKYNNIIAGSTLTSSTTTTKSITHIVVIGNMRDTAISRNDKLTITGYVAIGENEQKCYPSGATSSITADGKQYANVTLYSGTFTGANKYGSSSEDAVIYLRSIKGTTDGLMNFEMYGGQVTGNIYGGSATTTYSGNNYNSMDFYGGQLTGNIFGQGANATFAGGATIGLAGIINITGNVFGGSNVTTTLSSIGAGDSQIVVDSSSVLINGNIYGGSKSTTESSLYIDGSSYIAFKSGTVNNIYGGGYNCDISISAKIYMINGTINQNIYGGGYQGQVRTNSEIEISSGTIQGNVYGGSHNTSETQLSNDNITQDADIHIGIQSTNLFVQNMGGPSENPPTINGIIYGSGLYDKMDNVEIMLWTCANVTSVYGGSNANAETATANIGLVGMTVNEIYGGGQSAGTVGEANIYLGVGTVTDVYGGGFQADVTTSNIGLVGYETIDEDGNLVEATAIVGSIYGGSNTSGTVNESNVTLTSGTVTNVFGGGNSSAVGTANVTLNGITINTIHGGSKDAGVTTTTNVTLASGTVTNVFGGGLDVGVTKSNVTHNQGASVKNIYGGNNSLTGVGGDTGTTNVNIVNSEVTNVYGGNFQNGTTKHANITIQGTSKIKGRLYGGGYKSAIGSALEDGSATINISGGTIDKNINGGSEESIVYGTTNINIGKDAAESATGNSSLVAGNILINGTIYGSGDYDGTGYDHVSVIGNTNILMDNSTDSPITYGGTIYGSGNGATYSNSTDNSTIHLKDFGTETSAYKLISIERTGNLYIGNSFIELIGRQDQYNYYKRTSYTLNRITNGLTIYNNTTLYTQRGFNMVGGFNSYSTFNASTKVGTKATTENVENRLYTLEGINLIFAKQEGNIYADNTQDIWGDVNGMTFFGMYAINRTTGQKQYDIYAPDYAGGAQIGFFANGTFVEGRHKSNHDIEVDGFYTNVADYTDPDNIIVTQEVIEVVDYGTYYDWIIGADIVNYELSLIGSTYGKESMAELQLDYKYAAGATYTLNRVSLNALNTDVNLIDPLTIPTISANANNTFGLTMETDKSGWLNSAVSSIYTTGNPLFKGDTSYRSDNSINPGTIIFKLYNSINITEQKDLGNVNIILTGKTTTGEDGSEGNTFIVVIAVNLQTIVEELKEQYEPSFTDRIDTELSYTKDSKVDLSYLLYKEMETTPYVNGDYRVISSTIQLPVGTKLTMKDYGQGDSLNKVYYYHVIATTPFTTETKDGVTRYLYRLSNFIEMGDTDSTYVDNNSTYYHSGENSGYALEKYDISIDFGDATVSVEGEKVTHETYLELRNSDGTLKYDNGATEIKYNLYSGKNAILTETISNQGSSYTVVEDLTIPFTLNASVLEQGDVMDTKYYDQIAGIAIQIVDEYGIRVKSPELQNFKLTNDKNTTEVYEADANGVIRMPVIEGFATLNNNYTLSITQANVAPGTYKAQVHFFTSDDGQYYSTTPVIEKEFNITFVSKLLGLVGVESQEDSRIINKTTGLNLQGNSGVDMTISIGDPTNETNIRVELYKRNPTYTNLAEETTYTGTSYTLVDISQYLDGTWETPETHGLTSATDSKEYIVSPRKTYSSTVELETIDFEKALKQNIATGEYKLVFKAYSDNTLVQTVKKTFIVTP